MEIYIDSCLVREECSSALLHVSPSQGEPCEPLGCCLISTAAPALGCCSLWLPSLHPQPGCSPGSTKGLLDQRISRVGIIEANPTQEQPKIRPRNDWMSWGFPPRSPISPSQRCCNACKEGNDQCLPEGKPLLPKSSHGKKKKRRSK